MTAQAIPLERQRKGESLLLLVTLIWGSTFIIIRDTLPTVGTFTLLSMRFAIGFLILFLLFFKKMMRITRADLAAGTILGVLFFVGNALQTSGLRYTNAGTSGFITAMSVVIVPVLAVFMLSQRPTKGAILGVVLATAGLALLSLNATLTLGYGDVLTLGCAVAFAFHIIYVTKYASSTEPVVIVAVQLGLAAIASFAVAVTTETISLPPPDVWRTATYLGLLPTAFCFVAQVYGQRLTSATRAALIFTAEPVFAAIFAYVIGGEVLGPRALAGSALILAGMLAAELA